MILRRPLNRGVKSMELSDQALLKPQNVPPGVAPCFTGGNELCDDLC